MQREYYMNSAGGPNSFLSLLGKQLFYLLLVTNIHFSIDYSSENSNGKNVTYKVVVENKNYLNQEKL